MWRILRPRIILEEDRDFSSGQIVILSTASGTQAAAVVVTIQA